MQRLAMELGRALLFPVRCRYCTKPIWLFATAEGGFTIFDEIGAPWPKHSCWGVWANDPRYVHLAPQFSREFDQFPVPAVVPIINPAAGACVTGVVVRRDREPDLFGLCQIVILCGDAAHRVWTETPCPIGQAIKGVAEKSGAVWWLRKVQELPLPERAAVGVTRKPDPSATQPTPVGSLSSELIWRIQEDAVVLRSHQVATADAIELAVEALVANRPLCAAAALAAALLWPGQVFSSELTERHVRTLFLTLRDLGLEVMAPKIGDSLSEAAMRAIGPKTLSIVREVTQLGHLKRQKQTHERIQRDFVRGLSREKAFLDCMATQYPAAWDYVNGLKTLV